MGNKRKLATTNGKVKKTKTGLSKEAFLNEIGKLKLYTEGDRYYDAKTDNGRLELYWK